MGDIVRRTILFILLGLFLEACGVRSAPSYDYDGNDQQEYVYPPRYE